MKTEVNMHYFLFYSELGDVIGWLETEHGCTSKNAKEVNKEEFIENGGTIGVTRVTENFDSANETENAVGILLDSFIQ